MRSLVEFRLASAGATTHRSGVIDMHPMLTKILMVRDKDLRKWGRFSAILMLFLGIFFGVAAVCLYDLVQHRLQPSMLAAQEAEKSLVARLSDQRIRVAFEAGFESRRKVDQIFIDASLSVILWGGIGGAVLCFANSAVWWRAYELAAARPISEEPNQQIERAEATSSNGV